MQAKIDDNILWNSGAVKLIGITLDNEHKFNAYIKNFGMKAQ